MSKQFDTDRAYDQYYLYDYTQFMKGWVFFPHRKLQLSIIDEKTSVLLTLPNGISLNYQVQGYGESSKTSLLDKSAIGISNFSQELPSGANDLRNVHIYGTDNWNQIVVTTPEGKTYYYRTPATCKQLGNYCLEKEVLPNGKILRYTRVKSQKSINKNPIMHIESCDPQERFVYASIDVQYNPKERSYHFVTNSGQEADYYYEVRNKSGHIKRSKRELEYSIQSSPFLTAVNSPCYRKEHIQYNPRFLLNQYFGRNNLFSCTYGAFQCEDRKYYRVKTISRPVGSAEKSEILYDINYLVAIPKKRGGRTSVKHADGSKTVYIFTSHLLIRTIQYFDPEDKLKKEKSFSWNKKHWLNAITLKDGKGNIFYEKSYSYDKFGNPILEIIKGDISGNGDDEATIKRQFSQDGRNLLLREEREEELFCYHYLSNTNLKTAVFTKVQDKVIRRNFYDYDACNNLIRKIEDDGSALGSNNLKGVSERKITTYVLRQEQPFLHMPEWVIESYFDQGNEKLLQKKKLSYNSLGYVSQEEIYDAEGVFAYSIFKEYNECGNLLSETNALGQKALYEYDDRGNHLLATSFSQKTRESMQYDSLGRLIQKVEGSVQINRIKSFEYDKNSRLVQETDGYDNPTRYLYDPIANKVSQEIRPSIVSKDGVQEVKLSTRHDSFGRAIAKTDANGNTTYYKYNIYDSPTEITHPNSSKEFFRYDKRGQLLTHKDREGEETRYTYDSLGRIRSKTLASLTDYFEYNGFHCIKKVNKEGNSTQYLYDGAGRVTQEKFCDKVTEFSYDALGRQSKIIKHNQDNTLVTCFKMDLLDRVIEQTESSLSGEILSQIQYAYDEEGNRSATMHFVNNEPAAETFAYDPFKRLTEHRDPSGNLTSTSYDDFYKNSLGQRVLSKTVVDPEGVRTIEEYNPFGQVVKKEVMDNQKSVSLQENVYDSNGNTVEQKDYLSGRTLTLRSKYNNLNLLKSVTRAFGTLNARTTHYTYTPAGRVATKQLPDQTVLSYAYTPTGKLKSLTSSNNQINHRFEYNKCDLLTRAHDNINQVAIEREVDAYGNTTKENFSTGIAIKKSYDLFDRMLLLEMGAFGRVLYDYDPRYLRDVTRAHDAPLYTHRYMQYDLAGNLLEENLINDLGIVQYSYDKQGRHTAIDSSFFKEEYIYSPKGNLITRSHAQSSVDYAYDPLSQLIAEISDSQNSVRGNQTYAFDALHNRLSKNGKPCLNNDLNELTLQDEIICTYDLNGNLVQKASPEANLKLVYDPLNRLIQAEKGNQIIKFTYDPLGRRLAKSVHEKDQILYHENYLYDGMEEIGAVTPEGKLEQLRVLGLALENKTVNTVAIELNGQIFASIADPQQNIRILVDSQTKKAENIADFTAFGEVAYEKVTKFNPWSYAAKRYDPELGLVNFGKRYYDPQLARWLSPDPAGFKDSRNLYQFLLNNPHAYVDPNGQFVIPLIAFAFGVGAPAITICVEQILLGTAITALAVYGGDRVYHLLNDIKADQLISQLQTEDQEVLSEDKKKKDSKSKGGRYAPDRPLPQDKYGKPIPESENPQTQLGKENGRKGKYTKAREFGENGVPVTTIEFTDHGRPHNHTNPHQHRHVPNKTGGTPNREDPEPLEDWRWNY